MDLLGDYLLFGLGPTEGPLLFGSIRQGGSSGGGMRPSRPYERKTYQKPVRSLADIARDDNDVALAIVLMTVEVINELT